jgi:hypothetical protein
VGPTVDLDTMGKRQISCPCPKSNPRYPASIDISARTTTEFNQQCVKQVSNISCSCSAVGRVDMTLTSYRRGQLSLSAGTTVHGHLGLGGLPHRTYSCCTVAINNLGSKTVLSYGYIAQGVRQEIKTNFFFGEFRFVATPMNSSPHSPSRLRRYWPLDLLVRF